MILEPDVVVFYVDNLATSSKFYQDLLGIKPEEASMTFHRFKLSNGMNLGLKTKHSVVPPAEEKSGNCELAFTLDNNKKVDLLYTEWQGKDINIAHPPTLVPYGYTFLALDPDGNRLRVCSLDKS